MMNFVNVNFVGSMSFMAWARNRQVHKERSSCPPFPLHRLANLTVWNHHNTYKMV